MISYLLDTDICISFLKGKYELQGKCKSIGYSNCFVSAITIAELQFGAHKSSNYAKHKDEAHLVASLMKVLPILESTNLYGKEKARLQKIGKLIDEFDLLIATTAVYHNLILVTNNTKHMQRVEGIRLENWTKAEDNEFIK